MSEEQEGVVRYNGQGSRWPGAQNTMGEAVTCTGVGYRGKGLVRGTGDGDGDGDWDWDLKSGSGHAQGGKV